VLQLSDWLLHYSCSIFLITLDGLTAALAFWRRISRVGSPRDTAGHKTLAVKIVMETPGRPARRPIYEASFEDEPIELSPEMAHIKAMKESERMKKMREEVSVSVIRLT